MNITLMKGKIHRASVTEADLHYEESISIDRALLDAAGFLIYERVEIYNMDTGARFATYVIEAPHASGIIGLNGAAARFAMPGDKITIVAYASFDEAEAKTFQPRVVLVDRNNSLLTREFWSRKAFTAWTAISHPSMIWLRSQIAMTRSWSSTRRMLRAFTATRDEGLSSPYDRRENLLVVHTCGKALGVAGALVTASGVLRASGEHWIPSAGRHRQAALAH